MTDPAVVTEVRQARHTRWIVTGMFVALVFLFAAFAWWDGEQRDRDCKAALQTRDEYEAKDIGLWNRAADELEAPPEVRAEFLDFIHDTYAAMPVPSSCGGG